MNRRAVARLRETQTIRERAHRLLDLGTQGRLHHFAVDIRKLVEVADYVADVIRNNYPDLKIPYHGRWRHFSARGIDRWTLLSRAFSDKEEMVRAAIDLVTVSVLLDAGAGSKWSYAEANSNLRIGRSEGLAIATFHMFRDGLFSSDPLHPLRVDAAALAEIDAAKLGCGFQLNANNTIEGLAGRIALLKNLAAALKDQPRLFGAHPGRPGYVFDYLEGGKREIEATDILDVVLEAMAPIWPGRIMLGSHNLGDVWTHSQLTYGDHTTKLMPFHKLSQWLTYSLLEPFEWAGLKISGLDRLTGLAEYRNGGLFVDCGLLRLKHPADAGKTHELSEELVVEWRALTVALLDELRLPVAQRLGLQPTDFPLARLLEGGTWAAGRKIAQHKRPLTGDPPIKIASDGTVF